MLSRKQVAADIDLEAVRSAIGAVRDPEMGLTLAEVGMLGELRVDRERTLHLTVRLTTPTCPMREQITGDVGAAAGAVAGVDRVEVHFEAMSDPERLNLSSRLRRGRESGHPFGPDSSTLVYAIASGKGGVGKSTITANLAVALAQQGKRVGVLDADVWGWSIPQLFGVRRPPVALKGLMLPLQAHGVALMSVGFLVQGDEPVVWRGPMLHKAIEQFLGDVYWGELDVMLIDLPPGTGDVTLTLLELLPDAQLLAVTTPQIAAQTVAARVGRMALDARMPVAGVIENMSTHVCSTCDAQTPLFGEGGGARLAADLGTTLLGQIPLDLPLRSAGDIGLPAMTASPNAASALELRRIATQLPVVRRSLIGRSLPLSVV